jgi:hypothetical protein
MLKELGYDPALNPPNYGIPDPEVVNNTNTLQKNRSDTIRGAFHAPENYGNSAVNYLCFFIY